MCSEAFINIYANLVDKGRRTIESLPEAYRKPVQERVDNLDK